MINRDKQLVQNQDELIELSLETDIKILEIQYKSAIILDLKRVFLEKKNFYKALKAEIKEIEEHREEFLSILY